LDRWTAILDLNDKPTISVDFLKDESDINDDFIKMKDFYSILGLTPGCGHDQIHTAYERTSIKNNQIEITKGKKYANEQRKFAGYAFEILSHPIRRVQYDQLVKMQNSLQT
jgi:DnaJ-class molecular chaperone